MGSHPARDYWEGPGLMLLIGGMLIAPAAWFLDLQASYAAVKWACAHDRGDLIRLVPVLTLVLLAAGTWMSWTCWTKLRDNADQKGARLIDRSLLLALSGLALNAIFGLLLLTSMVPRFVLSPCE
ncbi:MAG TPA: hypothetical protein VIL35_09430 [Vicinamibacterales bacterium]